MSDSKTSSSSAKASTAINNDSDSEILFSDDGLENITYGDVKKTKLRFGKYKGHTYKQMLASKQKRDYLRYIAKWENANETTKAEVDAVLKHYATAKKTKNANKKKAQLLRDRIPTVSPPLKRSFAMTEADITALNAVGTKVLTPPVTRKAKKSK